MISELQDLDAAAVLAASEVVLAEVREREVDVLRLALQWADIHSTDPDEGRVLGADQLLDFGGEGTPAVRELCWGEFAISQQMGVIAARHLAADALDLRHRLPLLWEAVQDLRLPVWVARKVAAMSRRLAKDVVDIVDLAAAAAVDQSPGRILAIAEAKVIEADPEAHRVKIAKDAAEVGVKLSQPRPGGTVDEPGTSRVTLKLPKGTAIDTAASIDEIADLILEHLDPEAAETITRGELQVMARASRHGWRRRPRGGHGPDAARAAPGPAARPRGHAPAGDRPQRRPLRQRLRAPDAGQAADAAPDARRRLPALLQRGPTGGSTTTTPRPTTLAVHPGRPATTTTTPH